MPLTINKICDGQPGLGNIHTFQIRPERWMSNQLLSKFMRCLRPGIETSSFYCWYAVYSNQISPVAPTVWQYPIASD